MSKKPITKPNDIATPNSALMANQTPPPNMKYCGRVEYYDKSKRKIAVANDPIESYSDCGRIVNLPPADFQKQRRLFYHQSAAEICRLFPGLYKLVIRK